MRLLRIIVANHATCSTTNVYMWSALFPISNHSHIRQLQFATQAFSQKVLQQAVQISICQWLDQSRTSLLDFSREPVRPVYTLDLLFIC